ncbi:AsmA-like C-terminal region-containing protein [Neorickettsia sp. 179522]|uniref:AsmA-like C-terminal region-containing protein n=1 Tax=Neorickettsia sp. 179522 TaxID=1714371 RepID=UPI000794BB3B|nr:AsmA-like C-terminal region-containing protein [Neorickettsia sp. 179522]KYH12550.1 hypothetical protein AS219_01960 [Neorickettsia sp. 179522]
MVSYRFPKIVVFFLLMIILCFLGGFVIKLNADKRGYLDEISHLFGGNIEVHGDISISFLSPGLKITSLSFLHHASGSRYAFEELDIDLELSSLIFSKPRISKIGLKNGKVVLRNANEFPVLKFHNLHFQNTELIVPDYAISTYIKNGMFSASEKEFLFSGKVGRTDKVPYDILIRLDKRKNQSLVKLSSKKEKLQILLSEKEKHISGSGKDLLRLFSTFTDIAYQPREDSHFVIGSHYDQSKNSYSVTIDSDLVKSVVNISKDHENNKVEINSSYIDLSRVTNGSLEGTFLALLNIQRELLGKEKFKFIAHRIKLRGDETAKVQFDFLDQGKFSYIDNFSAQSKNGTFTAKGIVERNLRGHPILRAEANCVGTVPEWITVTPLSTKYIDITNLIGKQFNFSVNFVFGPDMFLINSGRFLTDEIAIDGTIQYNRPLKKVRTDFKASSLELKTLTKDNVHSLLDRFSDLDAAVRFELDNTKVGKNEISHIDFVHHIKQRNNASYISVDSDRMSFTGRIRFVQDSNILEIDLDGNKFDKSIIELPSLFNVFKENNKDFKIQWNEDVFPYIPSSLSGKFNVTCKNIFDTNNKEPYLNLAISGETENRILKLTKFSIKKEDLLFEMVANLTFAQGQNSIIASISAVNLDLGEIFKKYFKIDYISGKASVQGNLSSKGFSIAQIVKNLNGKITFNSPNIFLEGGDIDGLPLKLVEVNSIKDLDEVIRVSFFEKNTPLFQIDGSGNITNGIIGTSLSFMTKATSGVFSSHFSLVDMKNSSIARVFFNLHNAPIAVDINLEGSLWKPRIFFDNKTVFETLKGTKANYT